MSIVRWRLAPDAMRIYLSRTFSRPVRDVFTPAGTSGMAFTEAAANLQRALTALNTKWPQSPS